MDGREVTAGGGPAWGEGPPPETEKAAEREPRLLLGLFILFACFEVFFLGFVSVLDEALVGALLWWNVAIGNILA